jgi:hypothetical protein
MYNTCAASNIASNVICSVDEDKSSKPEKAPTNGTVDDKDSSPVKAASRRKGKRIIRDDSSDEDEAKSLESKPTEVRTAVKTETSECVCIIGIDLYLSF